MIVINMSRKVLIGDRRKADGWTQNRVSVKTEMLVYCRSFYLAEKHSDPEM